MDEFRWDRNNLDRTASPYLQQHTENPVWWQPWTERTIARAREVDKPLFVSVGYATCHWCHVMAAEAFSNPAVARKLNEEFVSVKVDREERPDIDHFLMQFLLATRGHGGWPLNAFLTPDLKPMLALTYVPVQPRQGLPGMVTILDKVTEFFTTDRHRLQHFDLWKGVDKEALREKEAREGVPQEEQDSPRHQAIARSENLLRRLDRQYGGFGSDTKFPPHSSLIFLLHVHQMYPDTPIREDLERALRLTLDGMAKGGLHDHLQGGFFRYCVDRQWTIPHFEKMLYDQAMLLWVYSLAFKVLGDPWYRSVAEGVVTCLQESFTNADGVYISAHDADTQHHEGLTYLWDDHEIPTELQDFFLLLPGGNFEGKHHLLRRDPGEPPESVRSSLDMMLQIRRSRVQPEQDGKIVTAWNALAATALVQAGRFLERPDLIRRAREIYETLSRTNTNTDGLWVRSSLGSARNETRSLEDYGAVLLLVTMLTEDAATREERDTLLSQARKLRRQVLEFRTSRGWLYTIAGDLPAIPADTFDSPTPSPVSLAEAGLYRLALLQGEETPGIPFGDDTHRDFHNYIALAAAGEFYFLEQPELTPWSGLPPQTTRILRDKATWCFRGACRPGAPSSSDLSVFDT